MKMYAIDIWGKRWGIEYIITMAENREEALEAFRKKGYNLDDDVEFEKYEVGEVFHCQYDG